jgi:predicted alpha/beta-fold hydrolase
MFTPAWFLKNPHAQTVWGRLTRPRRLVRFRREVLPTPDGDELILDHLDAPVRDARFRFVLLHGLEGSSHSVYMQGVLATIARHGFAATAVNFRSCARDPENVDRSIPNRTPRFYHSGETADFDLVVRTLAAREPHVPLLAFGASLGGNVLLKWLGEHPSQREIAAGATLSVPFDLAAGSKYMENRAGRFYVASFVKTLAKKTEWLLEHFPDMRDKVSLAAVKRARTFREFDDAATGPLHGFTGADDYYARSSSIRFLDRITTPVLCVSAEDDPFLPPEVLTRAQQVASPSIEFIVTKTGGHVGFVGGSLPWRCEYWAEELVISWLIAKAFESHAELTATG